MKTFRELFIVLGWILGIVCTVFLAVLAKDLHEYNSYLNYGDVTLLNIYATIYLAISSAIGSIICFWLSVFSRIKAKEEEYYDYQMRKLDKNQTQNVEQKLNIGDKFTIEDMDTHKIEKYTIVEREKQDVSKGLISGNSPIALKIAESQTGDVIELQSGDNIFQFKILSKKW